MGICYHCGSKSGIGKKSGKWFGCSVIFYADQYGTPTTENIFWESEEAFKSSDAVAAQQFLYDSDGKILGQAMPVYITRDASGRMLATLTIHESVEPLDITLLLKK